MAKNLRVLDLGKGIGLSGFSLQLLTNGLSDTETMKGLYLEELYFTYDPNREIVDDGESEESSNSNAGNAKIIDNSTYDESNYQHRVLLELNNKVILGFCNVIQTNKSLRVIRNHASDNMLLVARTTKDEMETRLTEILYERKIKHEEKTQKQNSGYDRVDDGDSVTLNAYDEDVKVDASSEERAFSAVILPKELNIFPGSQDVLEDVLLEISKPPKSTTETAVSSLMCAVTECFMYDKQLPRATG